MTFFYYISYKVSKSYSYCCTFSFNSTFILDHLESTYSILKVSLGRLFVAMFFLDPMRIPCSRDNLNIGLIKGPHVDLVQLSKEIKYYRIPYNPVACLQENILK
jgi:hypothetical protein